VSAILSELEKLTKLLEDGYITREEFDLQKKGMLASGPAPAGSAPAQTDLPDRVGAYRIQALLGSGGMGVVYRGRHSNETLAARQGGNVAIKVLYPQHSGNKTLRERFEREVTMSLKLEHRNIVRVFDLVVDGSTLGLVMELVEGEELATVIGKITGPIPWTRAQSMVTQLLDAIEHMHGAGLIHRDIKPANVLVQGNGQLKLLDMGIAKDLEKGQTKAGTGMGTVDYMAPEQYTDASSIDFRADIYALGFLLYEMLAGRLPWDDSLPEFEILKRKSLGEIPPPTEFYPDIPKTVVDAIGTCLQIAPGARYSSIGELRRAVSRRESTFEGEVNWNLGAAATRSSAASSRALAEQSKLRPTGGAPSFQTQVADLQEWAQRVARDAIEFLKGVKDNPRTSKIAAGVIVVPTLITVAVLWFSGGDSRACQAAESEDSLSTWEDYVDSRSDGACIQRARARARRLKFEAAEADEEGTRMQDQEACEQAGVQGTHSSWSSYLNTYPNGKCKRLAKSEVKRLPAGD